AVLRGVEVPGNRVAAGPVPGRAGADREAHLDCRPRLVQRAPDLGQVPTGAEVADPPRGIRLETARRQHHSAALDAFEVQVAVRASPLRADPNHAVRVDDELSRADTVLRRNTVVLTGGLKELDHAAATPAHLEGQPTPEREPVVDLVCLTAE